MNGIVARVMNEKGFGFIKGEDKQDYFFHKSDLQGFFEDLIMDFERGLKIAVTFDSVPSPKGPRAGNVRRLDYPN